MRAFYQNIVILASSSKMFQNASNFLYFPAYYHVFVIGQLQNYSNEQLSKQIQSLKNIEI